MGLLEKIFIRRNKKDSNSKEKKAENNPAAEYRKQMAKTIPEGEITEEMAENVCGNTPRHEIVNGEQGPVFNIKGDGR